MTREWQPIETAPKDGTVIDLWFPPGKHFARTGQTPKSLNMDERYSVGKWWSAEDVFKAVGRVKSETGPRGALLKKDGGYWGSAGRTSRPMTGRPTFWRPCTAELLRQPT